MASGDNGLKKEFYNKYKICYFPTLLINIKLQAVKMFGTIS